MRYLLLAFLPLSVQVMPLVAQESNDSCSICWQARPEESCKIIIVTDFGAYYIFPSVGQPQRSFRVVADWGVLINTDASNAIGATFFVSYDRKFSLGPEIRYRGWLSEDQSIDLAVGMPIWTESDLRWTASLYGLVKWNAIHWFAVALRPELRSTAPINALDVNSPSIGQESTPRFHMSVGIEFGWVPGLILPAVGAAVLGIFGQAMSGR